MDNKNFADLKYSKELGKYFPLAEWWWIEYTIPAKYGNRIKLEIVTKEDVEIIKKEYFVNSLLPALTTDMVLERLRLINSLPQIKIYILKDLVRAWLPIKGSPLFQGKSLCTVLCKMLKYLVREGVVE